MYKVIKTIHGRRYLYWQKTYRVGGVVKTWNQYIGPAGQARIITSQPTSSEQPKFVPFVLPKKEHEEDERIQYGPLEDRIARQGAQIKVAKKISGRFKPLNYFIGKLLVKRK